MDNEGSMIRLRAKDGHEFDAFIAEPAGRPRGGVVLGQEMYGVNEYLRATCRFFASHGYVTIAPSLYDRRERGLVFPYDREAHDRAQKIYKAWNLDHALDDLDAARDRVASWGRVAIVGYCWGGTLAWVAACRRSYSAAVSYYGSMMPDFARETPHCAVIAHVGSRDNTMTPARLEIFRSAQPDVPLYVWDGAQHGFDNPGRVDRYHADACAGARRVTLDFLSKIL
ncbi:MAG: dienelactone hydrolase family protein [Beijerinckiaceae bacterium]